MEQFLYRQAELLDRKHWQDWIDLFTPDGIYWMPPEPSYKTWDGQPAIFAEDKNLMTVRMSRVLHPGRLVAAAAVGHEPRGLERDDRKGIARTATSWCARAST